MEKQKDVLKMADNELIISRLINAPRELVWEAWTNPKHIIHWLGPNGFTNTFTHCDTRTGGSWRYTMHGPDGRDYLNKIDFIDVKEPEYLVYKHSGEEDTADISFNVRVTFEALGNKTQITMASLFPSAAELERVVREFGAKEGGHQTLNRLEEYATSMRQAPEGPIVMERKYDATPDELWTALTDREEMKKWYFDIEKFEPVLDFEFSFMGGAEDGTQYLHLCKITDVILGKRLEYSWRYDGYEGISYVRFELFPDGNMTRVRLTHRGLESFPSRPDFAKGNFVAGWTEILSSNLKSYLNNNKL